jgi:hypothetical protein
MQVFRQILAVENNQIHIKLPPIFNHESVEVIVLSLQQPKVVQKSKIERLNTLLSVGTWTADDVQPILETQQQTNQWKMESF